MSVSRMEIGETPLPFHRTLTFRACRCWCKPPWVRIPYLPPSVLTHSITHSRTHALTHSITPLCKVVDSCES